MWWLVAAELPAPPPDNTTAYLTFFGGVIATLGLIAVAYINSRKGQPPPASPSSGDATSDSTQVPKWVERMIKLEAKHEGLSEDHDQLAEAVEMTDRRVDRVEADREKIVRWLDRNFPEWRL